MRSPDVVVVSKQKKVCLQIQGFLFRAVTSSVQIYSLKETQPKHPFILLFDTGTGRIDNKQKMILGVQTFAFVLLVVL